MKLDEAFHLGIIPGLAGFRFDGQELLERLRGGASDALLEKVNDHSARLNARNAETANLVMFAERIMGAHGAPAAPRPRSPADYRVWAEQVAGAGEKATQGNVHETATYYLGRALGNLLHTLALRVLTDDLAKAAPDHPLLVAQREALAKDETRALQLFRTAMESPAHNARARVVLDEVLAVLGTLTTAAPREAVFRHANGAIPRLEAALRE